MIALIAPDHFLIMTLYALLVSAFFALLWRQERRDRWKLFGVLMASLVLLFAFKPTPLVGRPRALARAPAVFPAGVCAEPNRDVSD